MNKTKSDLTKKEWEDIQQPLDYKSGWSNSTFNKLYPNTKNPFDFTERDIRNKTGGKDFKKYAEVKQEFDKYKNKMSDKEKGQYQKFLESKKF